MKMLRRHRPNGRSGATLFPRRLELGASLELGADSEQGSMAPSVGRRRALGNRSVPSTDIDGGRPDSCSPRLAVSAGSRSGLSEALRSPSPATDISTTRPRASHGALAAALTAVARSRRDEAAWVQLVFALWDARQVRALREILNALPTVTDLDSEASTWRRSLLTDPALSKLVTRVGAPEEVLRLCYLGNRRRRLAAAAANRTASSTT
jgi:hypothetical protein